MPAELSLSTIALASAGARFVYSGAYVVAGVQVSRK
jgi:hypothetical protein